MELPIRSNRLIDPQRSALLVVDVQTKLLSVIDDASRVVHNTDRLCRGAQLLDVPHWATLQYPRGLGPIDDRLAAHFPAPEEKLDFSATACRQFMHDGQQQQVSQWVVVGIETHVCIVQTALDLLAHQMDVFVVADATASRSALDHQIALRRLTDEGAVIVTTESVLFEWCQTAANPKFKSISAIVREVCP